MTEKKSLTKVEEIRTFTRSRIKDLQEKYISGDPPARADLARLRRAVGKPLGNTPETWLIVSQRFPSHLVGHHESPSAAENAIFHAMTLYALHQQSKTSERMHVVPTVDKSYEAKTSRLNLGTAMCQLINPTKGIEDDKAVRRRFIAITTAQSFEGVVYHLRGVIQLLRNNSIPLDYGLLASDLYQLQFPESAKFVRLNWARQLHHKRNEF